MKIKNIGCYGFMRMTHVFTVCLGLPITRRRINDNCEYDRDSIVGGHRYAFDRRVVPVWLVLVALDAYTMYYNYLEVLSYTGESFKKCFEESYCFAVIELINRNVGPFSTLMCLMFYGRRHKVAALAGTEWALMFLRDTDDDCAAGCTSAAAVSLSPVAKYYSAVMIAVYCAVLRMYTAVIPATIQAMFCVNAMSQMAVFYLAMLQYYVLERGYARINQLLETTDFRRDPRSARRSLARLADTHDRLGRLVDHLNRAYVLSFLLKWPYTIMRIIMIVFRIIEFSSAVRVDIPFARIAAIMIVEHVFEILLFLLETSWFSILGTRLAYQANRTLASLQKLKLYNGTYPDLEIKKTVNIFWIRVNARKVNASIGGFININMSFMKGICSIIVTYLLVLIQFKHQKGKSKPLHHVWN